MRSAIASGSGTREQSAGVAGGDLAGGEQGAAVLGQAGQPQRVGDVAAALADDAGDVAVRIAVVSAELGVALRFLERVEVGALDVLDDRQFERFAIADIDDDDRHFVQAGALRGAPPPFAGDDLVGVGDARHRPDDHRLDDAALADRGGEFVEFVVAERFARVARVRPQEFDRRAARAAAAGGRLVAGVADQRGEAAAEARAMFGVAGGFVGHFILHEPGAPQAARQRPSR